MALQNKSGRHNGSRLYKVIGLEEALAIFILL